MATFLSLSTKLRCSDRLSVHWIRIPAIRSKFLALNIFSNLTLLCSKSCGAAKYLARHSLKVFAVQTICLPPVNPYMRHPNSTINSSLATRLMDPSRSSFSFAGFGWGILDLNISFTESRVVEFLRCCAISMISLCVLTEICLPPSCRASRHYTV